MHVCIELMVHEEAIFLHFYSVKNVEYMGNIE